MNKGNNKPKYFKLMEQLKNDIIFGVIRPGDKLPSENELSKQYDISRHTIRKAFSILSNDGYISAEHGKGTYCTYRLKNVSSSKNIAVITTYISDYIFPRVIQGIDRVLTENGYSIILKNTGNSRKNEAKCLEDILTKNIDGLIIEPSKSLIYCKHMKLYETLDRMGIPYVFIQGSYPQMKDKPTVLMDDVKGGYLVTKHLIDTGHKHIVGVFKADDVQGEERHKGYCKALQEAGVMYDPNYVIWFHTEDRDIKPAAAIEMLIQNKTKLDAVVCYNDQIAYEIMRVFTEKNIQVPKDISITGYDNSIISHSGSLKLTTITHPQDKLGEMAAELLLEKINGIQEQESKVKRLIEPELIIRESTVSRYDNK